MAYIRASHFLTLFLLCQIVFWLGIPSLWIGARHIEPDYHIVPPLPSETTVKALSLGDEEFMFRSLGFQLQNAGDTYGRYTPLVSYDYAKLQQWLFLLDTLNVQSHFSPALASYIYGQTPKTDDIRYIVDYIETHVGDDIEQKWWWLTQAVYLANYKLKDPERALELAYKLTHTPKDIALPIWTRQLPAFIHARLNENDAALAIIAQVVKDIDNIPLHEITFMNHFIQERLGYSEQTVEDIKG